MKKILLVLLTFVLLFSVSAFAVSAAEANDAAETVSSSNENDDMDIELDFQPAGFARNLKYMGLGMLGIFVVVGVVICITFGLNAATGKK